MIANAGCEGWGCCNVEVEIAHKLFTQLGAGKEIEKLELRIGSERVWVLD